MRRATSFKRQEFELRALQPSLHGVGKSDDAKVAFITRSFGHAWANGTSGTTATEDSSAQPTELIKLATTIAERIPKT